MNVKNANVIISSEDEPEQSQYLPVINFTLMSFGLLCFFVVFLAAGKLIWTYLVLKLAQDPSGVLVPQVFSLALLFLMGWGTSLITVRLLNNQIYPFLLRVLGIFVSFGMVGIYWFGAVKTYNEKALGFEKYAVVLFAGYLVLVAFYLLTEKADLRLMIAPLGFAVAVHIFSLVFHYIFFKPNDLNFFTIDLGLMFFLFLIIILMVRREPYIPLKQAIKAILIANTPRSLLGLRTNLLL